jgi:hypothetical protein
MAREIYGLFWNKKWVNKLNKSLNIPPNDKELLQYLNNELSNEESHLLENEMLQDAFTADAVEGLQAFTSSEQIDAYTHLLQEQIKQQTQRTKNRRSLKGIASQKWAITAIVLLLITVCAAYFILQMLRSK